MTRPPTIAQLRNLTDRAGAGLTADEQQRLRDGIDQLAARAEKATKDRAEWESTAYQHAKHWRAEQQRSTRLADTLREVLAQTPALSVAKADMARWQTALAGEQPGPAATQATEPATSPLRDQIAAALYERERPPNDPHWPDAYPMDREVFEPMADAALNALTQHLDIGEEQACCKTCRRAWNSAAHRCETDAEQQAYRLADILRTLLSAEDAPTHCHTHPVTWDGGGPCVYCTALAAARTALDEEQP